jgi:hypothetical protein
MRDRAEWVISCLIVFGIAAFSTWLLWQWFEIMVLIAHMATR